MSPELQYPLNSYCVPGTPCPRNSPELLRRLAPSPDTTDCVPGTRRNSLCPRNLGGTHGTQSPERGELIRPSSSRLLTGLPVAPPQIGDDQVDLAVAKRLLVECLHLH